MKYFIAISTLCFLNLSLAEIIFKNNGYEGIQIVIENGTPENPDLIRKIKDMFESGSKYMHHATGNLSYFRQASVVIPKDWNISSEFNVKTIFNEISFESADIRVGKANVYYKNTPYTLQPGGCFDPGMFIHFTPEYLLDKEGEMQELYGDPGRQLVHEWAHLRYGVFDEYGIPGSKRFPPFYITGEDFTPTSCNKDVKGYLADIDDNNMCYVDDKSGLPIECKFLPYIYDDTISSSIMYMPNILSVTEFCDDSPKRQHNFEAPSQQNILCNYLPTWNVIASHPDFGNLSPINGSKNKDFQLSILQPQEVTGGRYVIVGDRSGSMGDPCMELEGKEIKRIECINMALNRFIDVSIPDESYLGIVEFNGMATILNNMTKIDKSTREEMLKKKFSKPYDGTDIAEGLYKGIELLRQGKKSAEGGVLILLSDGLDNGLKYHVDNIVKSKVVINSVAIGESASVIMKDFVKRTGGKTFFMSNKQKDLTKLDQAFQNSISYNENQTVIKISVKSIPVLKNITSSNEVIIDTSLGRGTKFQFSSMSQKFEQVKINLVSPNGTIYSEKDTVFKYSKDSKLKIFSFDVAEPGLWTSKMHSNFETNVAFTLSSMKANSNVVPITSNCWLDSVDINLKERSFVRIFCQVSEGYNAIIKASVLAHIESVKGSKFKYQLHDDGSGADIIKRDGIYSAYFIDFVSNNRYTISVDVTSLNDTRVTNGTRSSSAPMIRNVNRMEKARSKFPISEFLKSPGQKKPIKERLAEKFQRFVTANSFIVNNFNEFHKRKICPSKITDLKVIDSNKSKSDVVRVKLEWTSSGNHLDLGKAKEVLIYYSDDYETSFSESDSINLINNSQVVDGSLTKLLNPHNPQTIEVEITNFTSNNIFFAMKTLNFNNLSSNLSNIIQISFIEIPFGHYDTTKLTDTTTEAQGVTREYSNNSKNSTAIVIGASCAVIGVFAIIILAFVVTKNRRKRKLKINEIQMKDS